MTHGESYLVRFAPQPIAGWLGVEPPKASTPKPTKAAKEPKIFADVVLPVLTHYCVQCHGPDKVKGELRLDSYAGVMKGGESGAALTAGAPDKSRMLTMLRLPLADDDHMPPRTNLSRARPRSSSSLGGSCAAPMNKSVCVRSCHPVPSSICSRQR
jgi:hypothetical protein